MDKMIFSKFYEIHPELNHLENSKEDFENNDKALRIAIERVNKSRTILGTDGLVGDLDSIIINVEDNNLEAAMNEFQNSTDYRFMSEIVGLEKLGIKQAFSQPSLSTLLVNEYISRFGDFDGFFIEENVTALTKATENQ